MAELLLEYTEPVAGPDGTLYAARACGCEAGSNLWQGWIEFLPIGGGEPVRSSRETTQPNRMDTIYWATGLTPVYLEGALRRALSHTAVGTVGVEPAPPVFDRPADDARTRVGQHGVLNPFSLYARGEVLVRRQLAALSPWHLVNIIRGYRLSDEDVDTLNARPASALVELIVDAVRRSDPRAIR
jgi:hypothetical protein